MKKNGFSLAELLVTLSIIAIAAAIAVPALNKLSPDRYKSRVLKYYFAVDNATAELLSNENIYYRKNPSNATSSDTEANGTFKTSTQFGCVGLFCQERPDASTGYDTSYYEGICKYPNLMLEKLQLTDTTQCTGSSGTAKGTSSDKTYWEISANDTSDINEGYTIMIDLDPSADSPNHVYKKGGNDECLYPDQFIFNVSIDGEVTASPNDKLTEVYLKNMTQTDRQADFDEAAQ